PARLAVPAAAIPETTTTKSPETQIILLTIARLVRAAPAAALAAAPWELLQPRIRFCTTQAIDDTLPGAGFGAKYATGCRKVPAFFVGKRGPQRQSQILGNDLIQPGLPGYCCERGRRGPCPTSLPLI